MTELNDLSIGALTQMTEAETREQCAQIAEQTAKKWVNGEATTLYGQAYQAACQHVAAAIRSSRLT